MHKSRMISGSLAERDLQLKSFHAFLPLCTVETIWWDVKIEQGREREREQGGDLCSPFLRKGERARERKMEIFVDHPDTFHHRIDGMCEG